MDFILFSVLHICYILLKKFYFILLLKIIKFHSIMHRVLQTVIDIKLDKTHFNRPASCFDKSDSLIGVQALFTDVSIFVLIIFPSDSRQNRDRPVGIAIGYGLDDRGVEVQVPVGSRIFSSPRLP
jgi:hypothetical protein